MGQPIPSDYVAPRPLPQIDGIRPLIDANKPQTTVKITLTTGQQTTLTLNTDHTIADIHTYVMSANPNVMNYQLVSGYPPTPLMDPSVTIAAAKLQQANVIQKLL